MRGGYGSSGHGSLQDRIHGTSASAPAQAPDVAPLSPARHCLVDGAPALLAAWRRSDAGDWEGHVVRLRLVDGEGWTVALSWLPADRIEPA